MKNIIEILKNLTPQQCIDVAKISEPDIEWRFVSDDEQKYPWSGHDLVTDSGDPELPHNNIFQIDYAENVEFEERFRVYEDLMQYKAQNLEKIREYLEALTK